MSVVGRRTISTTSALEDAINARLRFIWTVHRRVTCVYNCDVTEVVRQIYR
jgi:hypothetical protein